jgi:hypothetical protein
MRILKALDHDLRWEQILRQVEVPIFHGAVSTT